MLSQLTVPKIRPDHLDRLALIYVRQSTLIQVRENTGSTARQYDRVQRAFDLGWPREQIVVVDQDQARSSASASAYYTTLHLADTTGNSEFQRDGHWTWRAFQRVAYWA